VYVSVCVYFGRTANFYFVALAGYCDERAAAAANHNGAERPSLDSVSCGHVLTPLSTAESAAHVVVCIMAVSDTVVQSLLVTIHAMHGHAAQFYIDHEDLSAHAACTMTKRFAMSACCVINRAAINMDASP
jgi:hypothetical protein